MELLITGAGATALMAAVIGSLILAKGTEASSLHIFLGAAIVPIAAAFGLAIRRTHQHRYPAQKGEEVRPMLESILDFIASMLPKSSS